MEEFAFHAPSKNNEIHDYKCGLAAGQVVRLKKDLVIKNYDGTSTGEIHPKGSEWKVLIGIKSDPVLWFKMENGEKCTWDDLPEEVEEWFEV